LKLSTTYKGAILIKKEKFMTHIHNLRLLKKEIKILHSLVIVLHDALENETGTFEMHHIIDNLDVLILKIQTIIESYNFISETIIETEKCMLMKLLLTDTKSLLIILKYAIKAKDYHVTYEDVSNSANVISKMTNKIFQYAKEVNNNINDNNIIFLK